MEEVLVSVVEGEVDTAFPLSLPVKIFIITMMSMMARAIRIAV